MTDTPTSPSRTLRRCGCTPGACDRCAPRGCPCHAFVSFHGCEPYPSELDALLPSPPERLELPLPVVTLSAVPWVPATSSRPPRKRRPTSAPRQGP